MKRLSLLTLSLFLFSYLSHAQGVVGTTVSSDEVLQVINSSATAGSDVEVGIGVADPISQLHVGDAGGTGDGQITSDALAGSTAAGITRLVGANNNGTMLPLELSTSAGDYLDGTGNWTAIPDQTDDDWYEVGATSPDAINDGIYTRGNVGIAFDGGAGATAWPTSSPQHLLHVRGNGWTTNETVMEQSGLGVSTGTWPTTTSSDYPAGTHVESLIHAIGGGRLLLLQGTSASTSNPLIECRISTSNSVFRVLGEFGKTYIGEGANYTGAPTGTFAQQRQLSVITHDDFDSDGRVTYAGYFENSAGIPGDYGGYTGHSYAIYAEMNSDHCDHNGGSGSDSYAGYFANYSTNTENGAEGFAIVVPAEGGKSGFGTDEPSRKVEINSNLTDRSGLVFGNLTSASAATSDSVDCDKVLTVNSAGEVVLIDLSSCSMARTSNPNGAINDEQITALEAQVADLEAQLAELQNTVADLVKHGYSSVELGGSSLLYQNEPNPFNGSTLIRYELAESVSQASLLIRTSQGQLIKEVRLGTERSGSVEIQAGELQSGSYIYSLLIDGQEVDSKQMVLSK